MYYKPGPVEKVYPPQVYGLVVSAIDDQHLSFSAVAELLEDRGVLTPNGHKRWFKQSVKRLYNDALKYQAARSTETPN